MASGGGRLAMVVFSGTADRLLPVGIIASGAVAQGMDVDVFLTFWGLLAARKDQLDAPPKFSADYSEMARAMGELMRAKNVPSWYETLKRAKEVGTVRVHACAMTYDLMGMKKEDLADIVDDVIGVGEFVDMARNADITLFI
ncbi:MAG: DsrE/DsrF/DrsH-like family protein [Conexivisphaera sp.]